MAMAHVLRGSFAMMAFKAVHAPLAQASAEAAGAAARLPREDAHVAALRHWAGGDLPAAIAAWADILHDHPRDFLAFRLHHFASFWSGCAGEMAAMAEAVAPRHGADHPGLGALLGCRCFALEECGQHLRAETYGRESGGD